MANYPYGGYSAQAEATQDELVDNGAESFELPNADSAQLQDDELMRDVAASRHLSVIGKTLVFKGELSAEEDLLIQGRVEGSIKHNATNLTIGAQGHVKADIEAHRIIVQGQVRGDMRASESVTVETSARVVGNMFAPRIGLKEGAKFKGSIDMDGKAPAAAEQSNASTKKSTKAKGTKLSDTKVDELLD